MLRATKEDVELTTWSRAQGVVGMTDDLPCSFPAPPRPEHSQTGLWLQATRAGETGVTAFPEKKDPRPDSKQ